MKWGYLIASIVFAGMALSAVPPSKAVAVALVCAFCSGMWAAGCIAFYKRSGDEQ